MSNEIAKLFVTIGADVSGFGKGVKSMQQQLKVVGAAMTAAGAAGLKLVDSARQINSKLATTAITVGSTTDELRGLLLETADVTFGIESVAATFELLARAGVRGEEEMKASAKAFDALGDATFSSAEVVADMLIPAFKNLGVEIPRTAEELDSFTWLTKNTTVELTDFASAMDYVAAYGSNLNLTIEDMVAIMAALEAKGITGSAVTRVFRTAVSQAADGTTTLNQALGLSQSEIDGYKDELQGATGITQQYADAANTQYGIMDKLKFMWSKLTLQLGSFLTPLEPILAGMTAMGPVMIFLGSAAGKSALAFLAKATATMKSHFANIAHTGSSTAVTGALTAETSAAAGATTAQLGLNKAMMANPIIAIIAAIAGLVTMLVLMWKNWETVSMQMEAGWLRFKQLVGLGMDTTRAQLDALKLEATWIGVRNQVKEAYDGIVMEVDMATKAAIANAKSVADQEKMILEQRAQVYRDKHYEKMDMIDEEMMAELRAIDPVLAAQVEGYNEEIKSLDDREEARRKQEEADRVRALKKELRDDETSKERKNAIERELEVIEDAGKKEALIEERNLAMSEANLAGHFENEQALIDQQLAGQLAIYNGDLEAFKQLNLDKLEDTKTFIDEYNRLMEKFGEEPGKTFETPTGPVPPSTRHNKPSPLDVIDWFKNLVGMQHGGVITEPTLLYGLRSQRPYAIAGEAGMEYVTPAGGGGNTYNYNVSFPNLIIREEADINKISRKLEETIDRTERRRGI